MRLLAVSDNNVDVSIGGVVSGLARVAPLGAIRPSFLTIVAGETHQRNQTRCHVRNMVESFAVRTDAFSD